MLKIRRHQTPGLRRLRNSNVLRWKAAIVWLVLPIGRLNIRAEGRGQKKRRAEEDVHAE